MIPSYESNYRGGWLDNYIQYTGVRQHATVQEDLTDAISCFWYRHLQRMDEDNMSWQWSPRETK